MNRHLKNISLEYHPVLKQVSHFFIHLRWHYQVFILSGGFWLGGYISGGISWPGFLLQFINVHLLLFGGASAYNSYWDKDTGAIGGVKHPPPMSRWMHHVSLVIQFAGLIIATKAGWLFAGFYALSMLLFWLYSTPHFRWKAAPVSSLIAIGISTGFNSVLLGCFAAGGAPLDISIWLVAFGTSLILLSLYPVSQLFQMDEDRSRGDKTFAIKYGHENVIRFFQVVFTLGLLITGLAIAWKQWQAGLGFIAGGIASGIWINRKLTGLSIEKINYTRVMRLKYGCSISFLCYIFILMFLVD